jgi:imidazole glycerol-phosphate synthase subunit HisH
MITIIDYGLGNLASVANALEKLEVNYQISSKISAVKKSDAIILPGVGAAGQGIENLKKLNLDKVIVEEIRKGKPFLGICLGMQLMFEKSEEGNTQCLGIIKGSVKKFSKKRKVPQIGWNNVKILSRFKKEKIFTKIPDNSFFYFVNSFYCSPVEQDYDAGKTQYGEKFTSVVIKENAIGMQFHPEKSGKVGFILLENFIKYYVN